MVSRQGLSELYVPPPDKATTALALASWRDVHVTDLAANLRCKPEIELTASSIVFVHGLFGHPHDTWTWMSPHRAKSPSRLDRHNGATNSLKSAGNGDDESPSTDTAAAVVENGSVFWPKDLLRAAIPDVRIYTWGYDADIASLSSSSRNTIHQHARNLLSDLVDLRAESEHNQRPLIFVVHSLGGIIVKAAINLSRSTEGTKEKEIAPATAGVCFLGTPHRGSPSATIGKIAFQITKAAGKSPNTKILQGLERNSETLDVIGDDFNQTIIKYGRKIHIHSFREEKRTKKSLFRSTMIVDADSAKIGQGHEGIGSIPADHSSMTKFYGAEDVGFKRVSAKLRPWVNQLREEEEQEDNDDCLNSLISETTKIRFHEVKKADGKTFHWLFDAQMSSFSSWLGDTASSSPVFWIRGKPGSGKSTLMKFAIHDARTWTLLKDAEGPDWTCASFFFHDRGSAIQKSLAGMIQEIVGSLLRQVPELLPFIEPEFNKLTRAQRTKSPAWHLESLKCALHNIIEQRKIQIRIILFLDALDEHAGNNEELVEILKSMSEKADNDYVSLKVCLASRSWSVFEHNFSKCPGLVIDEHTRSDIQVFTGGQLQASIDGFPELLSLLEIELLTEQITAKALGVFIWVRLVVDQLATDIRDGTPYQMLVERITQMPQELKDLYADILRRLNSTYIDEAYVMLQIAMSSLEPLTLDTFMQAVNFVLRNRKVYDIPSPESSDFTDSQVDDAGTRDSEASQLRRLSSRTGGILETFVTISEESSADHKEEASSGLPFGEQAPSSSTSSSSLTTENATIHTVQFLHTTAKEYIEEQRYKLLQDSINPVRAGLSGSDLLFLCCASNASWVFPILKHMFYYLKMAELHDFDRARNYTRHLILGLSVGTPKANRAKQILSQIDGIFCFVFMQHIETTKSFSRDYVLQILAVAANAKKLVKHMLDLSDDMYWPPLYEMESICLLHVAAAGPDLVPIEHQDRTGMIRILVSSGYPIDNKAILCTGSRADRSIRTSFQVMLACKTESAYSEDTRLDIVKCLLDQGSDVRDRFRPYSSQTYLTSPLVHCVRNESAALVRLLLEYKADAYSRDSNDMRPIDFALIRQDKAIMKAFVDYGCARMMPDIQPNIDEAIESGLKQSMLMGSIGHPVVAVLAARVQQRLRRLNSDLKPIEW